MGGSTEYRASVDPSVKVHRDSWRYRRIAVYLTALLCFTGLFGIAAFGPDDQLRRTIADSLFWLLTLTVLSYIGAPILDEFLKRKVP